MRIWQLKTDGVSDDEMLVRSIAGRYREFRDDCFKTVNFPYPSFVRFNTSENEQQQAKEKPLMRILAAFTPSAAAAASKLAEARTDRRVAALRIIEALRMHAAAKAGPLPTSLDEITLVPIPLDPVTGKPFSYKKNGEVATLSAPPPATGQPGLTYHITLKK
jgi:hypothetical protein